MYGRVSRRGPTRRDRFVRLRFLPPARGKRIKVHDRPDEAAAEEADRRPKLTDLHEVMAPLAPYHPNQVALEAKRADFAQKRLAVFGAEEKLPEKLPPRQLFT